MIAIIDIDETVADNRHRHHFVENTQNDPNFKPNWGKFLAPELVAKDLPIPHAKEGLIRLSDHVEAMFFLTGRNTLLKDTTISWLGEHMALDHYREKFTLRMRPQGELSNATQFKGGVLKELRHAHGRKPFLCFDDDKYMWKVYPLFGGIIFRAPHCWEHIFPQPGDIEPETLPNPTDPEAHIRK